MVPAVEFKGSVLPSILTTSGQLPTSMNVPGCLLRIGRQSLRPASVTSGTRHSDDEVVEVGRTGEGWEFD